MKVGQRTVGNERGSALLATLCFAAVLSLSLSSYLAVCYRSLVLSNRGMQSTHSIELAEVGMEEALWTLNNGGFDGTWAYTTPLGVPTATKTVTGFTYENGATGQVQLTVANYNKTVADFTTTVTPNVNIISSGIVTLADHTTVVRSLQSNVQPAQVFTNAIGSLGNLAFSFGGTVDSYTATNPLLPATYTYGFSAVVSGTNVDLGNASIDGFAATRGTVLQNQPSAKLTGTSTGTGIDPTRVSTSANQPLFDVTNPSVVPRYDPITSSAQLTNSDTISTPGAYQYDSILLDGSKVLTIDAPVVLKVTNYVYIGSASQIHVTTNGSLQLLIDATNHRPELDTLDGGTNVGLLPQALYMVGGGIVNDSQLPQNVSVLVDRNISTDSYSYISSSLPLYGSLYLPNTTVNVVDNSFTLYGAMVGKKVAFAGSTPAIHYDTALQQTGIAGLNTPFALVQMREISNLP